MLVRVNQYASKHLAWFDLLNRRSTAAFSDILHTKSTAHIFLYSRYSIMQAFTCQRCKQPLRIDDSLADLDSASADLLTGKLSFRLVHGDRPY